MLRCCTPSRFVSCLGMLVAFLYSTATWGQGSSTKPAAPSPTSQKANSQPHAQAKTKADHVQVTVIRGKVVGWGGQPLSPSHVELVRVNMPKDRQVVEVGSDGTFQLTTQKQGLFRLFAGGVFHRPRSVLVWLRKPQTITVDVQLEPLQPNSKLKEARLLGDFNTFSYRYPKRLPRQKDGTYRLKMKADNKKSMAFQLFGVTKRFMPIHLPIEGNHVYDKRGLYKTILKAKSGYFAFAYSDGSFVDLGKTSKPTTRFRVTPKSAVELHRIYLGFRREQQRMYRGFQEHRKKKKKGYYQHDWKPFQAKVSQALKQAKTPEKLLAWTLIESGTPLYGNPTPAHQAWMKERRSRILSLLNKVPPTSPLWTLSTYLTMQTLQSVQGAPLFDRYIKTMLTKHNNAAFRFYMMQNMLFRMGPQLQGYQQTLKNPNLPPNMKKTTEQSLQKLKAKIDRYIRAMISIAQQMKSKRMKLSITTAQWNLRQRFPIGTKLPAFRLPLLDHPNKAVFTEEDLLGKCTLLVFWATWCGPCIQKMPKLHKLRKWSKDKGLQMVSISYDTNVKAVQQFRKRKWKLPWYVSVAKKGYSDPIAHFFEIAALPSMIFVGPQGIVRTRYVNLNRKPMEQLLQRYLGQKPSSQPATK
ncbi:MAG: TlpA family protein disulfide reductase [Deltaproteobacteria bacterium]|nr:MAG: TlpA family protein disulfide reductase [Deltaproteobacteria bacterium]